MKSLAVTAVWRWQRLRILGSLIFTDVLTLLQGASLSTPGVALRGSRHQEPFSPLENDFQLGKAASNMSNIGLNRVQHLVDSTGED
jgi:hypothetical protein